MSYLVRYGLTSRVMPLGMRLASGERNDHPLEAMMSVRVRVLFPMIFALLFSCTSSSSGSEGTPVPLSAVSTEVASALCDRIFRCCDATQRAALDDEVDVTSLETCKTTLAGELRGEFDELTSAVDRGTATYNERNAGACVEAYRNFDCSGDTDDEPEVCDAVVEGKLAEGAECQSSEECAVGTCLFGDEGDGETGTCTKLPELGETCEFICAGDLVCSEEGKCIAPRARGEACATDSFECSGDLRCIEGRCADALPNGSPCMGSLDCQSYACELDMATMASTCVPDPDAESAPSCLGD